MVPSRDSLVSLFHSVLFFPSRPQTPLKTTLKVRFLPAALKESRTVAACSVLLYIPPPSVVFFPHSADAPHGRRIPPSPRRAY